MKALAIISSVMLAAIACGWFGGPPGKKACNQFKETIIDWRQGDINTFEFRENLQEVQEQANTAEPEIKTAATYLLRSANSLSEDRLEVSIAIMGEACAGSGYLDQHAF